MVADRLSELKNLQSQADAIRKELKISQPGEIIFQATVPSTWDDLIVVEADGFGGANVSIVEGDFPIDYNVKYESDFSSEDEAQEIADQISTGEVAAVDALKRL